MSERIDLARFGTRTSADAGFDLTLKSTDTGEPVPGCVLRILGRDSRVYQQALNEQSDRFRELAAQGKTLTREERTTAEVELAAALVVGWPENWDLNGEPLAYSNANAVKLLHECPAIREQIEEAASKRANFLPGSAKA